MAISEKTQIEQFFQVVACDFLETATDVPAEDEKMDWEAAFLAGLAGGLAVKVIDVIYQEIRRRLDRSEDASKFLDEHLDPILKSADEVVGKLRALAERDFKSIAVLQKEQFADEMPSMELGSFLYLIASYWARVELFRQEGLSVRIGADKRGRQLLAFFRCLEARRTRLVDRTSQRAIGESLITKSGTTQMPFIEFVRQYETNPEFRRWLAELVAVLCDTDDHRTRQRLLKVGVVMHAMIDTLDPKRQVTKERPGFSNKLSQRAKASLRHQVFGVHLNFVRDHKKYLTQKDRRPAGDEGLGRRVRWAAFRRHRVARSPSV